MRGWNPEDIEVLSATPADQFYKAFKQAEGDDLRKIIDSCLQFANIINATPAMKNISANATEALKRIGRESLLNKRRVRRYGIDSADTGEES